MDTAPVGMVSDAMTLSRFADCTLYIVRQGHTYKKQLAIIDSHNREAKLPKISIVINDVKVPAGYGAYGYGGNYGYGYGSGYFEDEPKEKMGLSKWFGWLGVNGKTKKLKKNKA
jgi:tyrosine-protein kinase Etk/Wzc